MICLRTRNPISYDNGEEEEALCNHSSLQKNSYFAGEAAREDIFGYLWDKLQEKSPQLMTQYQDILMTILFWEPLKLKRCFHQEMHVLLTP